ncbi:translation initiation factor IF-2 [Striga asiatica]|uniref:Translation initiation factor IF-2 n=1 Tax=Striga asiatica TaxID=4170 RepID=A0A5A7PV41_STRAF|nr:translation initiation factor IF-2 [Striga asiatica]
MLDFSPQFQIHFHAHTLAPTPSGDSSSICRWFGDADEGHSDDGLFFLNLEQFGYVGHFRRSDNTVKQCRADFRCRVRRGEELCACALGLGFGCVLHFVDSEARLPPRAATTKATASNSCSPGSPNFAAQVEVSVNERTAVDSVSTSQSDVQRRVSQAGRSNANSWLRFCVSIGCPTRSRVAGLGNCQASYDPICEEVKKPFTPPIASTSTVMCCKWM